MAENEAARQTRRERVQCPGCRQTVTFECRYVREMASFEDEVLNRFPEMVPSPETRIVCPRCGELEFQYQQALGCNGTMAASAFVITGSRRRERMDSQRGTGRTLRMCQVANIAAERGMAVIVIAPPHQMALLMDSPYLLDERIRMISATSRDAMFYFERGRMEGFVGLVLVDHYVWEGTGSWLAQCVSSQAEMGVDAPHVPPNWNGMPKGNDWLVVADYWADIGNTEQEALARRHHSLVVSHNKK